MQLQPHVYEISLSISNKNPTLEIYFQYIRVIFMLFECESWNFFLFAWCKNVNGSECNVHQWFVYLCLSMWHQVFSCSLILFMVSNRCVFTNHVASKIKMLELRHVSETPTTTSIGKLWKSFENIILFLFFFIQIISRKRNRTQTLGRKTKSF